MSAGKIAIRRLTLVLCATLAASGCNNFDLKKNIPWGPGEDGEYAPPMKVAAVWTDTILNQAGQPSLRGYGGRLMFYAAEGAKPIKVKGTLVVYAFDETGRDTEHVKPDRKYVFTAEQFDKHYSKSPLGHSYSVWLPWDEAGGPRREISLLVRFTPENGAVVIGEASRHNLPGYSEGDATQYAPPATASATGRAVPQAGMPGVLPQVVAQPLPPTMYAPPPSAVPPPVSQPLVAPQGVVPVNYQAPLPMTDAAPIATPPEVSSPRRMSTTTINLPTSVRARAPAQAAAMPALSSGMAAPSANAMAIGTASYAQMTPLQAAVAAAAHNGTAVYGNAYVPPMVTAPQAVAAQVPAVAAPVSAAPGAANSAAAMQAPAGRPTQSAAHFGPQRRQPLGAPLERLNRDHGPWQPSR